MEASTLYQQVVSQIEESGILGADHQTNVFSVYGGFVSAELARQISAEGQKSFNPPDRHSSGGNDG